MSGLRGVTLTVRFLCELAMLAALAYWGFVVGDDVGAGVLGIGAPLLAAAGQSLTAAVLGVAAVASSLLNAVQEHQTSDRPSHLEAPVRRPEVGPPPAVQAPASRSTTGAKASMSSSATTR